jgi:hypothetical protein
MAALARAATSSKGNAKNMTAFTSQLKIEISLFAKKEVSAETQALKKASAQ